MGSFDINLKSIEPSFFATGVSCKPVDLNSVDGIRDGAERDLVAADSLLNSSFSAIQQYSIGNQSSDDNLEAASTVAGKTVNLNLSGERTPCLAVGPVLFRFHRLQGKRLDLEIINPQSLDVEIDSQKVSSAKHLFLKDIDVKSLIKVGDIVAFKSNDVRKRVAAKLQLKLLVADACTEMVLDANKPKDKFANNILSFANVPSDISTAKPFRKEFHNFDIELCELDDNSVTLKVKLKEPHVAEYDLKLQQGEELVNLADTGLSFQLLDNNQFAEGLNSVSIRLMDANAPKLIDGYFPGKAYEIKGFPDNKTTVNFGKAFTVKWGESNRSQFIAGINLFRLARVYREGNKLLYDLEIMNPERKDIFVNSKKIHNSRHPYLKGLPIDAVIKFGNDSWLHLKHHGQLDADSTVVVDCPDQAIVEGHFFDNKFRANKNDLLCFYNLDLTSYDNKGPTFYSKGVRFSINKVDARSLQFMCTAQADSGLKFRPFHITLKEGDEYNFAPNGLKFKLEKVCQFSKQPSSNIYSLRVLQA